MKKNPLELLARVKKICEPYDLTVEIYESEQKGLKGAIRYHILLTGFIENEAAQREIAAKISEYEEIDRVLWEPVKKSK